MQVSREELIGIRKWAVTLMSNRYPNATTADVLKEAKRIAKYITRDKAKDL